MALLSTPTADDLLVNIRNMLNQPNATNSFWTDEELLSYVNEAIRRYYVEVVQHAEGQFNVVTDLDITADTETVALPSDFFELRALYRKTSQGYDMLFYRNNLTEGYATTTASGGDLYNPYYYFRGNSLVLRPIPGFTQADGLRLEYVQFPETIVTGGDSLTSQVSPIFKDLIETYAVYKAKQKESLVSGVNTGALAKDNLNDLFASFKEVIEGRSYSPTAIKPFNPEEY